jgi:hypothetical protein
MLLDPLNAILPLALEAVAFDGVIYVGQHRWKGAHRPRQDSGLAPLRGLGSLPPRKLGTCFAPAVRSDCPYGVVSREGVEPLLSFSDGRAFRTAVRLQRHPLPREELLWDFGRPALVVAISRFSPWDISSRGGAAYAPRKVGG